MASVSTDRATGLVRILFVNGAGQRKTIHLGRVKPKTADKIKGKVEDLNASAIAGLPIDVELAKWVAGISDTLAGKLAAVGLIPKRITDTPTVPTIGDYIAVYLDGKPYVKGSTRRTSDVALRTAAVVLGSGKP